MRDPGSGLHGPQAGHTFHRRPYSLHHFSLSLYRACMLSSVAHAGEL